MSVDSSAVSENQASVKAAFERIDLNTGMAPSLSLSFQTDRVYGQTNSTPSLAAANFYLLTGLKTARSQ